ncbi:MAG TPA: hypothetical protein VHQ03_12560 [Candidatus Dormibacteraeota bacterium]|nr:hypothetical protein [Candidatus Dormibacteraeota bacterium]
MSWRVSVKLSNKLSRNPKLATIIAAGIESSVTPLGFRATGRRWTWARPNNELTHLVGVLSKGSSYSLQWSVGCPAAAQILWGQGDARDIAYNLMAGVPSGVVPGAINGWSLEESTTNTQVQEIVDSLGSSLVELSHWLTQFGTRRALWTYLIANRNPVDNREFVFPAILPFKMAAAAALALAGGDREGCELLADVRLTNHGFRDKLAKGRLTRIEAAAREVCG